MEDIEERIRNLLDNPADLFADHERERIMQYCEKWKSDPRIDEIWQEKQLFFSMIHGNRLFSLLDQLFEQDGNAYLKTLSEIKEPYFLVEYLTRMLFAPSGWEKAVWILKNAPAVIRQSEGTIWCYGIGSVLAPTLLDVFAIRLMHRGRSTLNDMTYGDEELISQITKTLKGRQDGFYLAFHYTEYILSSENENPIYDGLTEALSKEFSAEACAIFTQNANYLPEEYEADTAVEQLADFGRLSCAGVWNALAAFRTVQMFIGIQGHEEALFQTFQAVLAMEARGFYTGDFTEHTKHIDIAELLVSQENALVAWDTISKLLLSARQRLSQNYYGVQTSELRAHICFLRVVSLRILDILYQKKHELSGSLWKRFWDSGLDDARLFSGDPDDFIYRYLSRLIAYYFVCFALPGEGGESEDTNQKRLLDELWIFEEIETMPVLILQSMDLLCANGFSRTDFVQGSCKDFFRCAIQRALECAEGRKKLEWVERVSSRFPHCS